MNSITFDAPFNKDIFIRSNTIFWEYIWRKRRNRICYWAGMSVLFFGYGIWKGIKSGVPDNSFIFIGIVSLGIMLLSGLEIFFNRRRHSRKVEERANKYEKENSDYVIKISKEGVEVKDFQSHFTLKWSVFTNFVLYKDRIILIPTDYVTGGLIIDKDSSGHEKYEQALAILEDKLMEA